MTGDGDGFCPCGDEWRNAFYQNGSAENRTVQHGADGSIRGFPHLLEVILFDARRIRSNGSAFDSHAVLFGGVGAVHSHLVVGFIAVFEAKIVIFSFQINIGREKNILYHLPDDTGHLVAVHLHKRGGHRNLIGHGKSLHYVQFYLDCSLV